MKPRIVSSRNDVDEIRRALVRFYRNKPHSYGLASREQSAYDQYADLICMYAPKKDDLLDLGCGSWRSPETIASRGFKRVIALDLFSDKTLEEYRQRLSAQQVEILNYDGATIPLASSSVDVVSSLCMFEHVINVERLLDESHRILRPGGTHCVLSQLERNQQRHQGLASHSHWKR